MVNLSITINTVPCNHQVQDPARTPGAHTERRQLGAKLPSSPLIFCSYKKDRVALFRDMTVQQRNPNRMNY